MAVPVSGSRNSIIMSKQSWLIYHIVSRRTLCRQSACLILHCSLSDHAFTHSQFIEVFFICRLTLVIYYAKSFYMSSIQSVVFKFCYKMENFWPIANLFIYFRRNCKPVNLNINTVNFNFNCDCFKFERQQIHLYNDKMRNKVHFYV